MDITVIAILGAIMTFGGLIAPAAMWKMTKHEGILVCTIIGGFIVAAVGLVVFLSAASASMPMK